MSVRKAKAKGILESGEGFVFRYEAFLDIKEALAEIFGRPVADSILYNLGVKAGRRSCKRILKEARDKREAFRLMARIKEDQNWGLLEFQDLDLRRRSGRVLVMDSFDAKSSKGGRTCFFFRGYLAGFLSELFKDDMVVKEIRCSAKGGGYCEFEFRRAKRAG